MLPDLHTGYQTMKSCIATTAGKNSVSNSPNTTVGPVARDSVTSAHTTAERFPLVDGITQSEFALTAIKSLVTFNPQALLQIFAIPYVLRVTNENIWSPFHLLTCCSQSACFQCLASSRVMSILERWEWAYVQPLGFNFKLTGEGRELPCKWANQNSVYFIPIKIYIYLYIYIYVCII